MPMLTPAEFTQRMEQIESAVARLSSQSEDPCARDAAELLAAFTELHGAALERMLQLIQSGGIQNLAILESFAQDDLVRTVLFHHDLHPVPLKTRVEEAISNLRPLVESYGGRVSIPEITSQGVVIRMDARSALGPSPSEMLKQLLEHALLVAAPDAGEVIFDERWPSKTELPVLPILHSNSA